MSRNTELTLQKQSNFMNHICFTLFVLLIICVVPQSGFSQCSNVNLFEEEEWEELFTYGNVPEADWAALIDCFIDWVDVDDAKRLNGAESDDPFYIARGYAVSNAPLSKVTELLLIKGFDYAMLYGGTNPSGVVLTGIVYQLTTWSTNGSCDCDDDSMPDWYEDGYEFLHPTNSSDAAIDYDSDFLSNSNEYKQGTSPSDPDTDHDRMLDGHEVSAGTNPKNPASFLGMEQPVSGYIPNSGEIIVQWQSVTGKQYKILRSTNMVNISPFNVVATGFVGQVSSMQYTDTTTAASSGPFFYRVEVDTNDYD